MTETTEQEYDGVVIGCLTVIFIILAIIGSALERGGLGLLGSAAVGFLVLAWRTKPWRR